VIDSHVILEKNEDYWKEPALDKITYKIITDKSVSAIALQNKEIDIVLAVLPTEVGAIASKDYLTITDSGIGSLRWIGFNCGHPLFTDPEIRKALTMAVDIDGAVKAIFANDANIDLAVRAYGPISPERPGSNQEGWKGLTPSYNPEEAQKILESKGWAKGSDGIYAKDGQRFSFKLQVGNNDANREKLAVIVSSQLQAIGIECTAQTVEWGTHTDDIKYGNVEMYILGGYGNLDGPYRLMHSDESNFSPNCKYASDEVDRLLEEAYKTIDYDARVKLIYDASAIFVSENAHLGGYFEYAQVGYNNRVTDFDYATVYNALCSEERNVGIAD
jgi:peptide/nickel transport system substrate-binding protein